MPERIVEVEWEDSNSGHGWQHESELPKSLLCVSVGKVIRDDDDGVLITESWPKPPIQEGQRPYGCSMAIPRSAIREVRELKRGRR